MKLRLWGRHQYIERLSSITPILSAGHGYPLQYCLKNPMDRGAWSVTVHRVAKSLDTIEVT